MRKQRVLAVMFITNIILLAACGSMSDSYGGEMKSMHSIDSEILTNEKNISESTETPDDLAPYLVMINGELYASWNPNPVEEPDEKYVCGTIEAVVSGNSVPTENNTSNVPDTKGGKYAVIGEEVFVQYVSGDWYLFVPYMEE